MAFHLLEDAVSHHKKMPLAGLPGTSENQNKKPLICDKP